MLPQAWEKYILRLLFKIIVHVDLKDTSLTQYLTRNYGSTSAGFT